MRFHLVAVIALVVVASLGCRDGSGSPISTAPSGTASTSAATPTLTSEQLAAATDAVIGYYAALAAKDCATLMKLVDPPMTKDKCAEAVNDAEKHLSDFDRVLKTAPDGRDPSVAIVTVQLMSGKGPREQLVRVKNNGGVWQVQP